MLGSLSLLTNRLARLQSIILNTKSKIALKTRRLHHRLSVEYIVSHTSLPCLTSLKIIPAINSPPKTTPIVTLLPIQSVSSFKPSQTHLAIEPSRSATILHDSASDFITNTCIKPLDCVSFGLCLKYNANLKTGCIVSYPLTADFACFKC